MGTLGLKWRQHAAPETVAKFYARAFNLCDHTRIIDCRDVHRAVCKSLGEQGTWVFDFELTIDAVSRIADNIHRELVEFMQGKPENGVLTFEVSHDRYLRLVPSDEEWCDIVNGDDAHTMLIPTGFESGKTHSEVYLRLDVVPSNDPHSILKATAFLFADVNTDSIAGFGDMTDYVIHLDGVPESIAAFLGRPYDVLAVNADVYRAWWTHHLSMNDETEFAAELNEFTSDGERVSILFSKVPGQSAWALFFKAGEECVPVEDYIPGLDLAVDPTEAEAEWHEIVAKFSSPFDILGVMRWDHVMEGHLERYADDFLQELQTAPEAVGVRFFEEVSCAVARLKENPHSWVPAVYNAGQEADLEFAGQSIGSALYLLAPLFLTQKARESGVPTVYLVATLRKNDDGSESCYFPSVLDNRSALSNMRNLRRAITNSAMIAA